MPWSRSLGLFGLSTKAWHSGVISNMFLSGLYDIIIIYKPYIYVCIYILYMCYITIHHFPFFWSQLSFVFEVLK